MTGSRTVFKIRKTGNGYAIGIPKFIVDDFKLKGKEFCFAFDINKDKEYELYYLEM